MEQGQRVKAVRKELGMTLDAFGKRVGVTKTAISNIENGARCLTDQMLLSICREFGVNETWLRTGAGEPFMPPSRSEEMGRLVKSLMADKPESFRSRLITALLRFDADGPEWQLLENIYNSVAADIEKETDQ
ncbi:MAG: helix-turn-helix transcriptional regulator [Firmicutes bacterium]|nr:helix-turn-helix transcriptional regulator [Bacillota bacterium]